MSKVREIGRYLVMCVALIVPVTAVAQVPVAPPVQSAVPPVQPAVAAPSPSGATPGALEYVLGPEDVVEIEVVGTTDKTRARVYTDGSIQTALGGRIMVSGKTPLELSAEMAKVLRDGGIYANPVVNVEVVGYASRYVTVLGAVSTPGLVPINRPYRLSERFFARVGGVKADAADYLVVRPETGEEKRYSIEKLSSGDSSEDPLVTAGEKIFSPTAPQFFISGQVNAPGAYAFKTDMTVSQAIAMGGGLGESGSAKKVKARRGGKDMKLKQDDKIEPGDVLTVGERLF